MCNTMPDVLYGLFQAMETLGQYEIKMDKDNDTGNLSCPFCLCNHGPFFRCNSGNLVCSCCDNHFEETAGIPLGQDGSDKTDAQNCQNHEDGEALVRDNANDVSKEQHLPIPDEGVLVDFDLKHNIRNIPDDGMEWFIKPSPTSYCKFTGPDDTDCKFKDWGCRFAGSPIKMRAHQLQCFYRPARCTYDNCDWTGIFDDVVEHTLVEHRFGEICVERVYTPMIATRHY